MKKLVALAIIIMILSSMFSVLPIQLAGGNKDSPDVTQSAPGLQQVLPPDATTRTGFRAFESSTSSVTGGGHYPSRPGETAYFGWTHYWSYNGNRSGWEHLIVYLAKYVDFVPGTFTYTLTSGYFLSADCWLTAGPPNTPTVVNVNFTIPPTTYVEYAWGFNVTMSTSVPCSYDVITNAAGGDEQWHWANYNEGTGVWKYDGGYIPGNVAMYDWPIIRPRITLDPIKGLIGDTVIVYGHDFTAGANVQILFNETDVASAIADVNGFFGTSFNVPTGTNAGTVTVRPVSSLDSCVRNATFAVKRGYVMTLTASPVTLVANGESTSTLTATVTTRWGAPVEGDTVNFGLVTALGNLEGHSNVEKLTGINGKATATYTAPTAAELLNAFGQEEDWPPTATDEYGTIHIAAFEWADLAEAATTVKAQASFTLTLDADPAVLVANEGCTSTITTTLKDSTGAPASGHTVEYSIVPELGFFDARQSSVEKPTGLDGSCSVQYHAPSAEVFNNYFHSSKGRITVTAIAWIDPEAYIYLKRSVSIDINQHYVLAITASPDKLYADGRSTSTVSITLKDETGAPIEGGRIPVAFGPVGSIDFSAVVTDAYGKAEVTYTAPDQAAFVQKFGKEEGEVTVSASVVVDEASGEMVTAKVKIGLGPKYKMSVVADPQKLIANGETKSTLTVTLVDATNNPAVGVGIVFSCDLGTLGSSGERWTQAFTDAKGTVSMEYTAPTGDEFLSMGQPSTAKITVSEDDTHVQDVVEIKLSYIQVLACWTRGPQLLWEPVTMSLDLIVFVADGKGLPVSGADVTLYAYPTSMSKQTDESGLARFQWDYITGNTKPQTPIILDYYVIASATIGGNYFQEGKSVRMAITPDSGNWVDNVPNEFWDRLCSECLEALGKIPGIPDTPAWALCITNIGNRIRIAADHNKPALERWQAFMGIPFELITHVAEEAGLKLMFYFCEKIGVIIHDWSENWKYVEDYMHWKDQGNTNPPMTERNGEELTPNADVEFGCPVNVLIIDPSGRMVGVATNATEADNTGNDLWYSSTYTEEGENKTFDFYNVVDGLYLIRIVGTADGYYDFSINLKWGAQTVSSQRYLGVIRAGETQWRYLNVNMTDTSSPIQASTSTATPIIMSCDQDGGNRDFFHSDENVSVRGYAFQANMTFNLYIEPHQTWSDNETLSGTPISVNTDPTGLISTTAVWNATLYSGEYDIIVDVDGNGLYTLGVDAIDSGDTVANAGFFVVTGARTIYVYSDNVVGPWNGSLSNPYQTITNALKNALDGDTIFVFNGTYSEDLVVTKRVSLYGESIEGTIINGTGTAHTVRVTANGVEIANFTVTNGGTDYPYSGIFLDNVQDSRVVDNNVSANNGIGIFVMWGSNNTVIHNIASHNGDVGIRVDGPDSPALLEDNTVEHNQQYGIFTYDAHDVIIQENTVSNNGRDGISLQGAGLNITVRKNLIEGNAWHGVFLAFANSSTVEENVVTSNLEMGIQLYHCINCTVARNNAAANEWFGIYLAWSNGTLITGNNVTSNLWTGIRLDTASNDNVIYHNNIENNAGQASVDPSSLNNKWDDGYPSGGNHWSDYNGTDAYSGPYQNKTGSDRIGDTPYVIDSSNQDNYPSMNPWAPTQSLVVRGMDDRIYCRFWNGTDWESWNVLPGSTMDSPAAAMLGNELHVVVRGSDGNSLWHGYLTNPANPESFSGWSLLSGATNSAPTLTSNGTTLYLVVRGLDNRTYYRCYSEGSWGQWYAVPTGATCDSPAASALGSDLHIVVRGMDESSLWDIIVSCDGTVVRDWNLLSGATLSKPVVTCSDVDSLCLVVRGMDNAIYYRSYTGSSDSWAGWSAVPTGATIDGPGATVVGNELCTVVRGMDGTTLWCADVDLGTSSFTGWTLLDGATPSAPTLTARAQLIEHVGFVPVDPSLTSPSGTYRWLDVADQPYGIGYRNSYNYSQASVEVAYWTEGDRLQGLLNAVNLKPNFAYQLKLVGTPGTADNERIGLAGRWWQEEWTGTAWANGQNLNDKGDGSSPNPNDQTYLSRRYILDTSSPTGFHYRYTGYLVFDYFMTDSNGIATLQFETGSCYHVVWKTTQRINATNDGSVKTVTFDPAPSQPAYDTDYPSNTVSIFGEWERLPIGQVNLQPGEYNCQIILTEESFHGSGGTLAGNWAGALTANIMFTVN